MFKKIVKLVFILALIMSTFSSSLSVYAGNDVQAVEESYSEGLYEDDELIFDEIEDDYIYDLVPDEGDDGLERSRLEEISDLSVASYTPLHSQALLFGIVTGSDVNNPFRHGPGGSNALITDLPRNTQLTSLGVSANGNWTLVNHGNQTGWVATNRLQQPPANSTGFIRPMARGQVTDVFGWSAWRGRMHYGIDMASSNLREPILAAASGTITRNEWSNGLGWFIVIRHEVNGRTYDTLYGHLRYRPALSTFGVGARVSQGQQIGIQGNTGQSYGAHLHFEIHPGGKHSTWGRNAVDPRPYIFPNGGGHRGYSW